jgi:hypothetical protein
VTVPVAVAALVPDRRAESDTAVLMLTETVAPEPPPPERVVATLVGWAPDTGLFTVKLCVGVDVEVP